jgi:hypothetical protein
MGTYAALSGNTVSNVIMADSIENAQAASGTTCVEYTPDNPAGIGWTYDETTGTFSAPVE